METRPRIFFDMDGTLAEWRNIKLRIDRYEDKDLVLDKLNALLMTEGYFKSLKPHDNVIKLAKLAYDEGFDVRICTCFMKKDGYGPREEKIEWVKEHMPWFPVQNIIFVPDGESKASYVPGGVRKTDILVDDYTFNLYRFMDGTNGNCIKMLNGVNDTKKTWSGSTLSTDLDPEKALEIIKQTLSGEKIKTTAPPKKKIIAEISADTNVEELGIF